MPTRLLHTINAPVFLKMQMLQNYGKIPRQYQMFQEIFPQLWKFIVINSKYWRFKFFQSFQNAFVHFHTIWYFTLLFPLANNFKLSYKAKRICVCFKSLLVVVISWYDILNVYSICVIATIISYVFYSETNDTKICTAS